MKKYTKKEGWELIKEYIEKNRNNFPSFFWNSSYYIDSIKSNHESGNTTELLDEIYYACNLFENDENPYLWFANFIEKNLDLI